MRSRQPDATSRLPMRGRSWSPALLLALALPLLPAAHAADKNGVSPNTISRPSGPGSLEGLGDAFQPALNTGTAEYTVKLALPAGVAGFDPELKLHYDSGQGVGPVGIGWTIGPGAIRRQTDKGLPRYGDVTGGSVPPDRFLGADGEELVPLVGGYYLAKVQGSYVRYHRISDHWEAHTKSGVKLEFGLTDAGRISDTSGALVYAWCLERQVDLHGNTIEYHYTRPSATDRQVYLSEIRYGPGSGPWTHSYSASFTYEDRPDPFTDYRSGFRVCATKRLTRVDMRFDAALIRRYVLGYGAHPDWSLLTTVAQYGADAESGGAVSLPVTTFSYATFLLGDPATPLSAQGHVIGSVGEPGIVMDGSETEFIDLNADGLPDILQTGVSHVVYLNHGVRTVSGQQRVHFDAPTDVGAADPGVLALSLTADNVHLADMTGDGLADFVVTETTYVEYYANVGNVTWGLGCPMSVGIVPPPAPFGPEGDHVRTADLDFDKRIDVLKSESGAYTVWFNLGGGVYSDPVLTNGAWHGLQFLDFADPGVELADLNGDRLTDVAEVSSASVVYCAGMGYGAFDTAVEMPFPPEDSGLTPEQIERARLADINGDGLADLIVERFDSPSNLRFWLNLGDGTFARSREIVDLPATPDAVTRWADINGNGTTDLVYADSSLPESKINSVDIGELVAGSAHFNALTGIENGYGRKTRLFYRSTSDYYVDALEVGNPWTTSVPFPVAVVARAETTISLDMDGYPDEGPEGDRYVTDYSYRDGYYDPLEKQFRGFGFVKQIEQGDERFGGSAAPTLVTRYRFHTGAPDGIDNDGDGQTDEAGEWTGREEEPLKGVELWRETTALPDDPAQDGAFADTALVFERAVASWDVRDLCRGDGGALASLLGIAYRTVDPYGRLVRQAVRTGVQRTIFERGSGPAKELQTESDLDPLGNAGFELNRGDVSDPDDDLYTGYEYALNEPAWIMDRVSRKVQKAGGPAGPFVSEEQNFYDGAPFVGLPLGQMGSQGNLHRTTSLISGGSVPPLTERSYLLGDPRDPNGAVDTLRQDFDIYGNPTTLRDANGHDRLIAYDPVVHKFPVLETIIVGGDSPNLLVTASYNFGIGTPATVTDMNGHTTGYGYDGYGRLTTETLPGDSSNAPTHTYIYDLDSPVSDITTIAHTIEGDSPDVVTRLFFDGLGRKLGLWEAGGPVMKEVTLYGQRGFAWKVFQPYAGGDGTWSAPSESLAAVTSAYDATGRVVETLSPPDDNSQIARATKIYRPLQVVEYDGEDNRSGSPHQNTPKTLTNDGLDRLIEVREIETLSPADSGTFTTTYRYALPDRLAEIEDAKGNIKYMRYDGLGRRIFMNDCDRGHMTYTFDAVGNLLGTVDAKNQEVVYTYDGVNRPLTENYLDSGHPLSLERTPDVAYHYDLPGPDHPELFNTRGQLAWVEDLTGAEFRGYDSRGNLDTLVKRIDQLDGSSEEYSTTTLADSVGRVYQVVYPDGGVIRQQYDSRGLLQTIPTFANSITYTAAGQRDVLSLGNGVISDYDYDPRLRLAHLQTWSPTETLQDLAYTFDQADNVTAIIDSRPLPPGDPRSQTASYLMDNTYRLARTEGVGWLQEYDYDRLGNMVLKTSSDPNHPDEHLGDMLSGGATGTACRIGRAPADPPGPHALTLADDGTRQRHYAYDDNGNMTDNDGDGYIHDFKDRLGKVIKDAHDIRYLYDYTGRRVIKRVDGAQTSYISKISEIRAGLHIHYVFAGDTRLARVDGTIPPPDEVTQRITLVEGWNLFSFQVVPASTAPEDLLAGIAGAFVAVYGHDGVGYSVYAPGGAANTLTALGANQGYWIRMTRHATLLVAGPVSGESVDLPAGPPVLVGAPGIKNQNVATLFASNPAITSIWTYGGNSVAWRCFSRGEPAFVSVLCTTTPGSAYWVVSAGPVSLVPASGSGAPVRYFHADRAGSTEVVTDGAPERVSETVYYPFGTARGEFHDPSSENGLFYAFGGKERDEESSLHYFEARSLGTKLARFMSVDPLAQADLRTRWPWPQTLGVYSYALNNPLSVVDPSGMDGDRLVARSLRRAGPVMSFINPVFGLLDPDTRRVLASVPSRIVEYSDRKADIAASEGRKGAAVSWGSVGVGIEGLKLYPPTTALVFNALTLMNPDASLGECSEAAGKLALSGISKVAKAAEWTLAKTAGDLAKLTLKSLDLYSRASALIEDYNPAALPKTGTTSDSNYNVRISGTTVSGFQPAAVQPGDFELRIDDY